MVIVCVVAPFDHRYEAAAVAVKVTGVPEHIIVGPLIKAYSVG